MQSSKAYNIQLNAEISFKRSCFVPVTTAQHCCQIGCLSFKNQFMFLLTCAGCLLKLSVEAWLEFKVSSTAHDHTRMRDRGGWVVGGWGGWEGVTVTRTKATSCATSCRMFFVSFFLFLFLSFSSSTINYMYVSPTAVTTRGPAVAGGADADGRGSGGTFQMCSCGNTAVSGSCAGCARVANL